MLCRTWSPIPGLPHAHAYACEVWYYITDALVLYIIIVQQLELH